MSYVLTWKEKQSFNGKIICLRTTGNVWRYFIFFLYSCVNRKEYLLSLYHGDALMSCWRPSADLMWTEVSVVQWNDQPDLCSTGRTTCCCCLHDVTDLHFLWPFNKTRVKIHQMCFGGKKGFQWTTYRSRCLEKKKSLFSASCVFCTCTCMWVQHCLLSCVNNKFIFANFLY